MTVNFENNNPAVQQNGLNTDKAVSFGSTLAVTGASTLNGGATVTGTQTVNKLVVSAISSGTLTAVAIDLSAVLGSQAAIKATASADTTIIASSGTISYAAGFLKIDVGGTARFIPFFK